MFTPLSPFSRGPSVTVCLKIVHVWKCAAQKKNTHGYCTHTSLSDVFSIKTKAGFPSVIKARAPSGAG